MNPATLYSTWKQIPSTGPVVYLVVWRVTICAGEIVSYELLRLFDPEFKTISAAAFKDLVDAGRLVEWSIK